MCQGLGEIRSVGAPIYVVLVPLIFPPAIHVHSRLFFRIEADLAGVAFPLIALALPLRI